MDESSRVQIIDSFCHLVNNVLAMLLSEDVLTDESMQVYIHVFEDQVNVLVVLSTDNLFQSYYVGVWELHQKHNLSVGALCVCAVAEGIKVLLKGFSASCATIHHFPDVAICPSADLVDYFEAGDYVALDLLTHPTLALLLFYWLRILNLSFWVLFYWN